jgi:predicted glycosyltransferase involved in capsule biosynthesis
MSSYSMLIAWSDRPQLGLALKENRAILERHRVETIVVNAGGRSELLRRLLSEAQVYNTRAVELPDTQFNKSLCINIAAYLSSGRCCFLTDGDIIVSSDVFAEAEEHLVRDSTFVVVQRIIESLPESLEPEEAPNFAFLAEQIITRELISVDGRKAVLRTRTSPNGMRGGHGLVLLRKEDLIRVGGLNSNLLGWGYEDTDFQIRLQFLLNLVSCETNGHVLHLTHGSHHRDDHSFRRNMFACFDNYSKGNYMGTFHRDCEAWRDKIIGLNYIWQTERDRGS